MQLGQDQDGLYFRALANIFAILLFMHYVFLLGAIIGEVIGTTALKLSDGFSRLVPSIVVLIGYGISFFLLSLALKNMGVGTAYAIWSALGTAIVAGIGVLYFKEPLTLLKLGSVVLVIIGVVGLTLGEQSS